MKTLSDKLVKHYACFNSERFWVDEHDEDKGYLSIVSSINDTCPIKLCRGIARFCKKNIDADKYKFIYVGAWVFETSSL